MTGAAAAAVLAVLAIFAGGERLLNSARWAVVGAAAFAGAPLVWNLTRAGSPAIYAVACVAVWLACIARIESGGQRWWPAAAAAALGIGLQATHAAAVMMPVYAAVSIAVFSSQGRASIPRVATFASVFAIAGAPAAIWWLRHPDVLRQLVVSHHLYDADRLNVLQGAKDMASWVGLTARSEVYYDYFNPAFLFLSGGVLPLIMVVLLPLGLCHVLAAEKTMASRIVLLGFVAAPFAASLDPQPPTPARIVFITPFAAILAACGARAAAGLVSGVEGSRTPAGR